ncbi:hypothetical protein [Streptomyces sp. NPDC127190]|uniref:hypothetical protein n=1 Tax=unclassified Streptomyces TaxID=2593676 RepID=UPI00363AF56E
MMEDVKKSLRWSSGGEVTCQLYRADQISIVDASHCGRVMVAEDLQIAAWAATSLGPILVMSKPACARLRNFRSDARFIAGAKEALTIGTLQLHETDFRQQSAHPLFPTGDAIHPDNAAALNAVLSGERRRKRKVVDQLWGNVGDSLVLLGSPTSEGLSRLVFGYQETPDRPDYLRKTGLASALPFSWNLDGTQIKARAKRWVQGLSEPTARPNWSIQGEKNHRWYPDLRGDDFLKTDYLLITKIPNILVDEDRGSGHFIVSIGGAHGTGTRSIERVLSNKSVLRKIVSDLRIDPDDSASWPNAYQVLLRAGKIEHDPWLGSSSRDVEYVDSRRISESSDWWNSWRRSLAPEMAKLESEIGSQAHGTHE